MKKTRMQVLSDWFCNMFGICGDALKLFAESLEKRSATLMRLAFLALAIFAVSCNEVLEKKTWIILLVTFFCAVEIFQYLHNELLRRKRRKFIPKERFTKRSLNGDISISEERLHQAIIYLSILEDEL